MKVSYTILQSDTFLGKSFITKLPLLKLEFSKLYYMCLIDTGADISLMNGDLGKEIGLVIEKGEPFPVKGIDGVIIPSYIHKIEFYIDKYFCKIDAAFSERFNFPFGLIGRKDFFDLFRICFNQKENFFEIVPY